jgi:hypothetical protein
VQLQNLRFRLQQVAINEYGTVFPAPHVKTFTAISVMTWYCVLAIATLNSAPDAAPTGQRHALIICGHPGDDAHQELFAGSVNRIRHALTSRLGFDAGLIRIQFGSRENQQPTIAGAHGRATRTEIEAEVQRLAMSLKPNDTLWVIVMGHAHFDGREAFLNLPGPDVNYKQLGELFRNISCRQQVFFVTTPASGFVIKTLSRPGHIVITATEADLELNETLFHGSLAKVLEEIEPGEKYDTDKDSRLSVFDLYIAVTRDVIQQYLDDMLIPTEHAQLDDNGDGRGTEVQIDYLTPEQGGREERDKSRQHRRDNRDGAVAATIALRS